MSELLAVLDGRIVGALDSDRSGRLRFTYDAQWRNDPDAIPLSLSLPLAAATHQGDVVEAVLWGLLPDNEHTLQRWATQFQVSARNPLALLANVGEDCAGAVQFVRADAMDALAHGNIEWLDETAIAERLKRLRQDSGAGRFPQDEGQFSLAGAQPKTALIRVDGRWGIPSGNIPTTHILKPPSNDFDGYAENEHFCMKLAAAYGLPTAASDVLRFNDEVAIAVARYDRIHAEPWPRRVHQEDLCQALGVHPRRKYQNEGGPTPKDVADLLWTQSSQPLADVNRFFQSLLFNWLIAGSDAHAKNYSILLGTGGDVRLAPLYDLSSAHPYPRQLDPHKLKMAMKTGNHYRWRDITLRDWHHLAEDLKIKARDADIALKAMAEELPPLATSVAAELADNGITHNVIPQLVEGIKDAAAKLLRQLDIGSP
ncbi:MAG: type II toxin-antitoxin system HipA family toxin [Xanthomonadales bacterium]|nr:type II toxin-antitoxin system HipA family toxin [Xanthomonadales bacterium]